MQLIILSIILVATLSKEIPNEVFHWKQLEFAWTCPEAKETAIECGNYIPDNNALYSLSIWKNKLFVTVPRYEPGIASSLNYINLADAHEKSPKLCPYPNWDANRYPESGEDLEDTRIVSAEAVRVDECDRLWVLDMGYEGLEPWAKRRSISDPAIMIYDLCTDKLIRRYNSNVMGFTEKSRFNCMTLDSTAHGDTVAYICDMFGYAIVVYSFRENRSWRIQHNYFSADPFNGYIDFNYFKFALPVGLHGIALSDIQDDGYRTAYFHAVASSNEFKVSTKVLMNATYANSVEAYNEFQLLGDRGPYTPALTSLMDPKNGIIYFAVPPRYSVNCWNTNQPLNPHNYNIVVNCDDTLFPFDLAIDSKENLWVISSNIPRVLNGDMNKKEVNHRILKLSSEEASRACDLSCS